MSAEEIPPSSLAAEEDAPAPSPPSTGPRLEEEMEGGSTTEEDSLRVEEAPSHPLPYEEGGEDSPAGEGGRLGSRGEDLASGPTEGGQEEAPASPANIACLSVEGEERPMASPIGGTVAGVEETQTQTQTQTGEEQGAGEPPLHPHPLPLPEEDVTAEGWRSHRKHVFVLSEAGKPIYSRYGNEEALSSTMGVMMALVSFVQASGNIIRSIQAEEYQVVFCQHGPLVLVCVSRGGLSERQLRAELLCVYQQVVSMLTRRSLHLLFSRKQNYDLRRLLSGSEKMLHSLLRRMEGQAGPLLGAVRCLPLPPAARLAAGKILQRHVAPNLVFSVLLAPGGLVSIAQERAVVENGRLGPSDLHILFNLLDGSSSFRAGETWTPVCLPCLFPDGYFYAYVSYLRGAAADLCLLLLSTDRDDFHRMAACKAGIERALGAQGVTAAVAEARARGRGWADRPQGLAELRHFVYKPLDVPEDYTHLPQYASPEVPAPYNTTLEKERLVELYHCLHSSLHNPDRQLKLIYHVGTRETLLAWVTDRFELYACLEPLVGKQRGVRVLADLLHWLKREEEKLFILYPPHYSPTPAPSLPLSPRLSPGTERDPGRSLI